MMVIRRNRLTDTDNEKSVSFTSLFFKRSAAARGTGRCYIALYTVFQQPHNAFICVGVPLTAKTSLLHIEI